MVSKIYTAQTNFLGATIVTIEVDLSKGLHSFSIVGLPSKAVDEAKDRISSAIKNSGWKSPKAKNQKIVISLAPADIKKDGTGFDLAMALAYLSASEEIKFNPKERIFLGELSLDGTLRPIPGVLPMVREAKARKFKECFVPKENAIEASLIEGITVYPAESLMEVVAHVAEGIEIRNTKKEIHVDREGEEKGPEIIHREIIPQPKTKIKSKSRDFDIDIGEVKGQETAKRGLQIAIAGGHNILMYGPPGTGKTMLAKAASGLLPVLSYEEVLEVTSIYSVHGGLKENLVTEAPFRSPHHTASYVSIIGGGASPRPGEVTLAHKGILFLDEMPEFSSQVLETLREPLEEGKVRISRAKGSAEYPANFMLIGAMNPCPCGNRGIKGKVCICSPIQIERYKRKLSGPIADRIDLWVEVSKIEHDKLADKKLSGQSSKEVREIIQKARDIQKKRYSKEKISQNISLNSELSVKQLTNLINLTDECKKILNDSAKVLDLSARAYHRIIKTSRTIADLEGEREIKPGHILEALQYRPKMIY
jgi:magnesium chelatase family protein